MTRGAVAKPPRTRYIASPVSRTLPPFGDSAYAAPNAPHPARPNMNGPHRHDLLPHATSATPPQSLIGSGVIARLGIAAAACAAIWLAVLWALA